MEKHGRKSESRTYEAILTRQLPEDSCKRFYKNGDGSGNLEYIIANLDGDLSKEAVSSFFASPEERAHQLLNSWMPNFFPGFGKKIPVKIFLKHTLQSLMGTHCIFGLEYEGCEIEEHSFVVHLDRKKRVVMVCCTYLPSLPSFLAQIKEFKLSADEAVQVELKKVGLYDQAYGQRMWLLLWNQSKKEYKVVAGNQVKLNEPERTTRNQRSADVWGVPQSRRDKMKEYRNSPGWPERKLGLGEVTGSFPQANDGGEVILEKVGSKRQGILLDLDSASELTGKYAAIRDEIDVYTSEGDGVFLNKEGTVFDRVNAYYYLDYIQRHFREKFGFDLLDRYPYLNPLRVVLKPDSVEIARYSVNSQKIILSDLSARGCSYTAARDPRVIYHEFVHAVTDAIARLHRGGELFNPRAGEILQAQAMDEGMAYYFACSLAAQQGAQAAHFYYGDKGKWIIQRNLDPEPSSPVKPVQIKVPEKHDPTAWKNEKYKLGERWGCYLWQLRKSLTAEIADMLIAHSMFFLTRWATFEQGLEALLLADRLLFKSKHERDIRSKYADLRSGIDIVEIPFRTKAFRKKRPPKPLHLAKKA